MKAGTKSVFNKEKLLPATQELPFAISHYCCSVMKKKSDEEVRKGNQA